MQIIESPPPKQSFLDWITNNQVILGYLFILPSLIGFILFYAYPAVRAVGMNYRKRYIMIDCS